MCVCVYVWVCVRMQLDASSFGITCRKVATKIPSSGSSTPGSSNRSCGVFVELNIFLVYSILATYTKNVCTKIPKRPNKASVMHERRTQRMAQLPRSFSKVCSICSCFSFLSLLNSPFVWQSRVVMDVIVMLKEHFSSG